MSSKCRSEGEEGLTFVAVGAGGAASSTFPQAAAAAATGQGVFEVVMVTQPDQVKGSQLWWQR